MLRPYCLQNVAINSGIIDTLLLYKYYMFYKITYLEKEKEIGHNCMESNK